MGAGSLATARGRRRRRALGGVLAAAALVVASCGDDDDDAGSADVTSAPADDGGSATTSAGGDDGPTTTSADSDGTTGTTATSDDDDADADAGSGDVEPGGNPTVGTGDVPAEGEPIKVMTVAPINSQTPPYPNIHEAARIYGEWLNDRGGINGRPLEVILCDGRGDPNEDANCGRQAAEEGVVALVGSFSYDFSQLIPILEDENLALFGSCCPIAEIELSSPVSFVTGSNFAIGAGAVQKLIDDGCESTAVVIIDVPIADFAESVTRAVYEYNGRDPDELKFVRIPLTAADYSAQVAQAIDGTDCIYGGISDQNWASFLPAMQSLGGTQRLYGHQGNLNGPIAQQFPELTDGGISVNAYPNIAGPMWDDYRAALEEYDAPDLDWNSLAGLGTWAAYEQFVAIVQQMDGEITNDTFMDAANSATNVETGGMAPPLDLSTPWDGMGGAYPRVFNRTVTFDQINDGELTPTDDPPQDMTEALNSWTPDS
jgi:branched-chain amino acid transport system substrate-binding protein